MKVFPHDHSLTLIDLNPTYPHFEQVYDDEYDLIMKEAFRCRCNLCHQEITFSHRYYYKCDKCDYSLHKSCVKLPTTLKHSTHIAHTFILFQDESQWLCHLCNSHPLYKQRLCYHCSQCMFNICLNCGLNEVQYDTIYHPSHLHPLVPFYREILTCCDACGKEHRGVFYICTTCFCYVICDVCIFMSKRLLIQDGTRGHFFHTHPLILNYSFAKVDQKAKYYPTCRICDNLFFNENLWVYKCEKCRYYAHVDCANLTSKQLDHKDVKVSFGYLAWLKYEFHVDVVLSFPAPDLTYNIFTDLFSKQSNYEMSITHFSHQHPLIFVDSRCTDISKVEDLCNGCETPIMSMPFYKCANGCNFVLHEWCTRLPAELKGHQPLAGHLDYYKPHSLSLLPQVLSAAGFRCVVCSDKCYGFVYSCVDCNCYIDVWCALTPRYITHKSHPCHLFVKFRKRLGKNYCRVCLFGFTYPEETSYSCASCNFHMHPGCALLLPETIRHKYDKHPLTITYSPVENHEGDYFCEVCEEELNPNAAFYHCHKCAQSIHTACAPLTPQLKAYIHGLHVKGVHESSRYKEFVEFSKLFAKTVRNFFQFPSSSTVPQGPSTSS